MPPLWPSRASTTPNSHHSSNATQTPGPLSTHAVTSSSRDKPMPPLPFEERSQDASPSDVRDRAAPSPSGHRSSSSKQSSHTRSASNPLPKFFGRKKSNKDLRPVPGDPSLDDELTHSPDELAPPTTGKRGKLEDEEKTARRCMCCDSRVKVPKTLRKFRCMCCLTINDLEPLEEQGIEREKAKDGNNRHDALRVESGVSRTGTPLSVERTRTIIDRCLVSYLESRCRGRSGMGSSPLPSVSAREDVSEQSSQVAMLQIRSTGRDRETRSDTPASSTPPDTPVTTSVLPPPIVNTRKFDDSAPARDEQSGTSTKDPQAGAHAPVARVSGDHLLPAQPTRKPPPPPVDIPKRPGASRPHPHGSFTPSTPVFSPRGPSADHQGSEDADQRRRYERVKTIFRPLEDYLVVSFGNYKCLNSSFSTVRPVATGRTRSESNIPMPPKVPVKDTPANPIEDTFELDAKMLLLGDIGENGSWWTGKTERNRLTLPTTRLKPSDSSRKLVSSRSPNINWRELTAWFDLLHTAGGNWRSKLGMMNTEAPGFMAQRVEGEENAVDIEEDLFDARKHAIRTLLKLTENLLKRPTRLIKNPEDARFLMILLHNPSLYPFRNAFLRPNPDGKVQTGRTGLKEKPVTRPTTQLTSMKSPEREENQHNGLLKRIFGLLAHSSETCHRYYIGWFAYLDEAHFTRIVDLVGSFVTHRLMRKSGKARRTSGIDDGGLIPDLSGSASNTSAQLLTAMGLSGSHKKRENEPQGEPDWTEDWQIKGAAKVMSLMFAANNIWHDQPRNHIPSRNEPFAQRPSSSTSQKIRRSGQLLPTSSFYNSLLDYQDIIQDFRIWESKRDKFTFSQYPLFFSMGAKIKILEYDARRQMEIKVREAYFDQIVRQRAIDGHFQLRIRRECIVDDSLRQISEAVGTGQEELKKGLRVQFMGEEGVDAGGPRKEWFLMLVRDIFDPNHGMFVYDEDSNACYFNPNSFETSDQYYLVGALLGLAIYNSTILDVALPSFAFRKLLAAAPSSSTATSNLSVVTGTKGQMTYTTADLAEFRPKLAAGLEAMLSYDGDVQATYCWDFVAPVDRYGVVTNVPLKPNGENIPVTNANRHEFVDLYVRYLLDIAVARQFEPFKRGFFTVCAGNALSLFRAEEIELLVRGSDEALNVDSLRGVALHENWKEPRPPHNAIVDAANTVPVVCWFWDVFRDASPGQQRKLLTFITGSDRIPAVGATSLVLRVVAGGDGYGGGGADEKRRFPIARTCFNTLVLWHYDSIEDLSEKLWRAVDESEGFGLK